MIAYRRKFSFRKLKVFLEKIKIIFDLNFGETKYTHFSLVCRFLSPLTRLLSSDALPEGLVRELPSADDFQKPPAEAADSTVDDLEELRRQLDALNS